ncbi:hypothetical protein Hamer_G020498 [Homarus americanus]|uniref:Uncharacterized protein n=1 Tax=Homarus americanus TaxID=6706 RepID=A0A8J5MJY0_HOMAM|nr:hypothetical protein Hamer_G020498 [Homarus americanus]
MTSLKCRCYATNMLTTTKVNSLVSLKKTHSTNHDTKISVTSKLGSSTLNTSKREARAPQAANKRRDNSVSPDAGKSAPGSTSTVTSSVVAALAERGGVRGRRGKEAGFNNSTSANRADHLQTVHQSHGVDDARHTP